MDAATAEPPTIRLAAQDQLAPAKINLALHVTGRRADGYHTLSSLVAFADVGDRLSVAPAGADAFEIAGPFAHALRSSMPSGARNSVAVALEHIRAFARSHGRTIGTVRVALEKNLPVASGIGGGSADAAALLRLVVAACPELAAPLRVVAAELGADVPMCVVGKAARIAGIGEIVTEVPGFPDVPAVLVNPDVPVSTPAVFRALARRDNPPMPDLPPLRGVDDLVFYLRATRNDLEEPAIGIAPAIADARRVLEDTGAAFARMSGSGATVFGIFGDASAAARAARAIGATHPHWWAVATRLGSAEGETS